MSVETVMLLNNFQKLGNFDSFFVDSLIKKKFKNNSIYRKYFLTISIISLYYHFLYI